MKTAQTILDQLGGNRFIVMTGAKQLVDHGNALSFRLKSNFAKNGINSVKITLTPADLYDVEFGKIARDKYKEVATVDGIYWDQLAEVFEAETGLYTSL